MSRLNALGSWFFTCLGITLLGVSILVVPADVFAAAGNDCYSTPPANGGCSGLTGSAYNSCIQGCCASKCGGTGNSCYNTCVADACQLQYENDSGGLSGCCFTGCGSTDPNNPCVQQCDLGVGKGCLGDPCEVGVKCFNQAGVCDRKNTFCNAVTGCKDCICRNILGGCYCRLP